MTRNYVVRPRRHCWVIEVDDEPLTLTGSQGEAIATALDAARRDAEHEHIATRVTLVEEHGEIVPLTTFGEPPGSSQLLVRSARRWAST